MSDDFATSSVRSGLSFSDGGEVLTVGKGANLDPIRLTNLEYPGVDSDAATKSYVDTTARGLRIPAPVRATTKTDADINTAYAAGETLDDYTLTAGDRILLQGKADAKDNGIWLVTTGKPTRPLDFQDENHVSGIYVFVDQDTISLTVPSFAQRTRGQTWWVRMTCSSNSSEHGLLLIQVGG